MSGWARRLVVLACACALGLLASSWGQWGQWGSVTGPTYVWAANNAAGTVSKWSATGLVGTYTVGTGPVGIDAGLGFGLAGFRLIDGRHVYRGMRTLDVKVCEAVTFRGEDQVAEFAIEADQSRDAVGDIRLGALVPAVGQRAHGPTVRDALGGQFVEIPALISRSRQNEAHVIDAGAADVVVGPLLILAEEQPGQIPLVIGVAAADTQAADAGVIVHGGAEHRHGVGEIHQPGVRATLFHAARQIHEDGAALQRQHGAAGRKLIRSQKTVLAADDLAQAVIGPAAGHQHHHHGIRAVQRLIQQLDPVAHRCRGAALQVRDAAHLGRHDLRRVQLT